MQKYFSFFIAAIFCISAGVLDMTAGRFAATSSDSIPSLSKAQLDSLRQQAIVDSLMSKDLGEVTVEGQSAYSTTTGMTYLPTKRQKSIAQNMTDLLRAMAIPQINVDVRSNDVTDNAGDEVALFINYLPATEEDRQGLRCEDVRKVEYLISPSDPRFRGAKKVLNFIVQEYEYGGYTKLSTALKGTQSFASINSAFSKFVYKKFTYDLFANFRYFDDPHLNYSEDNLYTLLDSDGKPYEFHRAQIVDKGIIRQKQAPLTYRATYNSDKVQIRNTIGYNFLSSPKFYSRGHLFTSSDPNGDNTYFRSNRWRTNSISYTGDYYFVLPHDFSLSVAPGFSYSYNHRYFDYQSTLETPISYDTKENAYAYNLSANLSRKLNSHHTLGLYLYTGGDFNDVKYGIGNSSGPQHFRTYHSTASLKYTFSGGKWYISSYWGLGYDVTKNNLTKISDVYPRVDLFTRYTINNSNSIDFGLQYQNQVPSSSYKTDEILQRDEILYREGNPFLKSYNSLSRRPVRRLLRHHELNGVNSTIVIR